MQPPVDEWLKEELPARFEGRILAVDNVVAEACGKLIVRSEAIGHRMEVMDAFIAATAENYSLSVVTRYTSHFEPLVRSLLNP